MESIEIRQNKKTLIPMLILLFIGLIGGIYSIYFRDKLDENITLKIVSIIPLTMLVFAIVVSTRKFFKNEPVLTLDSMGIIINEKWKAHSILWHHITDWKIKKDSDGGTCYLIIESAEKKKKVNISWLDKKPKEIEELISKYSSKHSSSYLPNEH